MCAPTSSPPIITHTQTPEYSPHVATDVTSEFFAWGSLTAFLSTVTRTPSRPSRRGARGQDSRILTPSGRAAAERGVMIHGEGMGRPMPNSDALPFEASFFSRIPAEQDETRESTTGLLGEARGTNCSALDSSPNRSLSIQLILRAQRKTAAKSKRGSQLAPAWLPLFGCEIINISHSE